MQTEILTVSSIVEDIDKINKAGKLLREGNVVAIPTETVYGLAANALDEKAVSEIFKAKGRPQDNPLIVHISEVYDMEKLCDSVPESAYKLANAFWPGPLTMIMKKNDTVSETVTAGLDTVGIRCPRGRFARAIIRAAGVPLAAPSANTSGKPSPTCVQHVIDDLNGKIPAIVDGGACSVGVESTVVDLTTNPPTLLRPGGITAAQLREVLGELNEDRALTQNVGEGEKVRAPGMKYRHYAPSAPVVILKGAEEKVYDYLLKQSKDKKISFLCYGEESKKRLPEGVEIEVYASSDNPEDLARGLFDALRRLDGRDIDIIYARVPENGDGLEQAIVNRLEKAAGFEKVEL